MTTQTEALKLALEAFKKIRNDKYSHWEVDQEIDAIEAALAQPEQAPVAQDRDVHSHMMVVASRAVDAVTNNGRTYAPIKTYTRAICKAIQADKNLLAKLAPQPKEPEQEPVDFEALIVDIECIDCRYRGDPSYDRDAYWMRDEVIAAIKRHSSYYTTPPQRKPLTDAQLDKAAMKLAECMDYPWEHMPEEGKRNMRDHAKAIIEAANGITKGSAA